MKPRSRYIPHSSSLTQERRSSRPGSYSARSSGPSPLGRVARRLRHRTTARMARGVARTIAMSASASSASSIGERSASRCARKEDHSLRVLRNLRVVLDHLRLAASAPRAGRRHGRPHPLVELAAKLLHETLLVLAQPRIALGEKHLAMTGSHPQELDLDPP